MGGHNQETQTHTATQVAETPSTETGGTTEAAPSGPRFTHHGPIPPATQGFKDPPPSPSDVAFGSQPHGATKPETKHPEARHAEARHAEAKPAAKSTEAKAEAKPTEAKLPTEANPDKPAEAKPTEAKHEEKAEAKPAEAKPAEAKPEESPPEAKPAKSKDFLTASQRARLEAEFMNRVTAAEFAYVTALTDLRVDKLVEKEEELPIWLSLLVGVGGIAMESTVMGAISLLKKSGAVVEQLSDAGVGVGEIEHEVVESNVSGLSEKTVEKLVGQMVDKAKEKTLSAAAAPSGGAAGEGEEKSATLSYIDYLRNNALVLFQHVREDKLATATDAELLAVFASFDANFHKITMYRAKLEEQIERYMSSHAKEIGHRLKERDNFHPAELLREEVRVAKILVGSTARYAYVSRDYSAQMGPSGGIRTPGEAYESEENALSYEEEGSWTEHPSMNQPYLIEEHGRAEAAPETILGYVEPELVEVAIASQERRWLQKMDTFRLDYSTSPPTLTKVAS